MITKEPYAVISRVYDKWTKDIDYTQVTQFILQQCPDLTDDPMSCLDVCCGTGNLMLLLAQAGLEVTGLDRSPEMLAIARTKLAREGFSEQAKFSEGNAIEVEWPTGPYDLVLCTFDSVNYFSPLDLSIVLRKAATALRPKGLFLFDINSEHKLRDVFGNSVYGETFDDYAYVWKNRFSDLDNLVTFEITIFLAQENSKLTGYSRFQERHVQYVHRPDRISRELRKAGFSEIKITDNYSNAEVQSHSLRIVFRAQKDG